jgi:hypothetical protein
MNFFLKIKQDKLLDGHITYQSHMSIEDHVWFEDWWMVAFWCDE